MLSREEVLIIYCKRPFDENLVRAQHSPLARTCINPPKAQSKRPAKALSTSVVKTSSTFWEKYANVQVLYRATNACSKMRESCEVHFCW